MAISLCVLWEDPDVKSLSATEVELLCHANGHALSQRCSLLYQPQWASALPCHTQPVSFKPRLLGRPAFQLAITGAWRITIKQSPDRSTAGSLQSGCGQAIYRQLGTAGRQLASSQSLRRHLLCMPCLCSLRPHELLIRRLLAVCSHLHTGTAISDSVAVQSGKAVSCYTTCTASQLRCTCLTRGQSGKLGKQLQAVSAAAMLPGTG